MPSYSANISITNFNDIILVWKSFSTHPQIEPILTKIVSLNDDRLFSSRMETRLSQGNFTINFNTVELDGKFSVTDVNITNISILDANYNLDSFNLNYSKNDLEAANPEELTKFASIGAAKLAKFLTKYFCIQLDNTIKNDILYSLDNLDDETLDLFTNRFNYVIDAIVDVQFQISCQEYSSDVVYNNRNSYEISNRLLYNLLDLVKYVSVNSLINTSTISGITIDTQQYVSPYNEYLINIRYKYKDLDDIEVYNSTSSMDQLTLQIGKSLLSRVAQGTDDIEIKQISNATEFSQLIAYCNEKLLSMETLYAAFYRDSNSGFYDIRPTSFLRSNLYSNIHNNLNFFYRLDLLRYILIDRLISHELAAFYTLSQGIAKYTQAKIHSIATGSTEIIKPELNYNSISFINEISFRLARGMILDNFNLTTGQPDAIKNFTNLYQLKTFCLNNFGTLSNTHSSNTDNQFTTGQYDPETATRILRIVGIAFVFGSCCISIMLLVCFMSYRYHSHSGNLDENSRIGFKHTKENLDSLANMTNQELVELDGNDTTYQEMLKHKKVSESVQDINI